MGLVMVRKVDIVLAHAPAAEKTAVAAGRATGRKVIGSNELWIVAATAELTAPKVETDATDAFKRLLAGRAKSVVRADNSGTYQKDIEHWKSAGTEPFGDWCMPNMGLLAASLRRAENGQAYVPANGRVEQSTLPSTAGA
jgi:tungstate transport system substrate-binding protein